MEKITNIPIWIKKMIKMVSNTMGEIIISLLLFLIIINSYTTVLKAWNDTKPVTDWFIVRQLNVNSIILMGEPIKVVYDREILRPFRAEWLVQVQRINDDGTLSIICSGDGESDYDTNAVLPTQPIGSRTESTQFSQLPKVAVSLDWFLGNLNCHLDQIGTYRLYVRWTMDRGKYFSPVDYERISNIFNVTDQAQLQKDLGLAPKEEAVANEENN